MGAAFAPAAPFILGGAAVSAAGAAAQGQAAKGQADFQAAIQKQQAERERLNAQESERDFRRQQSALMAHRRALLGARGVEAGVGSPAAATSDYAQEVELMARRIRAGGELAKSRLEQQAKLTKAGGQAAFEGGLIRAGSSLLSGLGRSYTG